MIHFDTCFLIDLHREMARERPGPAFELIESLDAAELLGVSVQGFAKGPDGGRDAKFVGTAELHSSKAAPWVGTISSRRSAAFQRRRSTFVCERRPESVVLRPA